MRRRVGSNVPRLPVQLDELLPENRQTLLPPAPFVKALFPALSRPGC